MDKNELEGIKKAIWILASDYPHDSPVLLTKISDLLNPPDENEFMECDTCRANRAKAGMPLLCKGCFQNRLLIRRLQNKKK